MTSSCCGPGVPENFEQGLCRVFDGERQARALADDPGYAADGGALERLVTTPGLRVSLARLREGASLPEARAAGPLVAHVLTGEVRLHAGRDVFRIRAGSWLAIPAGCPYTAEAVREAVILFTLAGNGGDPAPGGERPDQTEGDE